MCRYSNSGYAHYKDVGTDLLWRNFSRETEQMLDTVMLDEIYRTCFTPDINLIAFSSNTQLPNYVLWEVF